MKKSSQRKLPQRLRSIPALAALACAGAALSLGASMAFAQEGGDHTGGASAKPFVERLTLEEADAEYLARRETLAKGYARSGLVPADYIGWTRFTRAPYFSPTHSGLTVNIYVNDTGAGTYAAFGPHEMPAGSMVVKDAFGTTADAVVNAPMAMMEKLPAGGDPARGDWRFAFIGPEGNVIGDSQGTDAQADAVGFCVACHTFAADTGDWLYFPPGDVRVVAY